MSSLKRNISYYLIGSCTSKAIAFILVPIYISSMSTAQYGIVGSMLVIINVLTLLMSLGVERSIYRLYHDYDSIEEKKRFLGSVNLFIYLFGAIVLGLLFIFSNSLSHIYKSIDFYPYFCLSILISYTTIYGSVPLIYLQTSENAGRYLLLSLLGTVVNAFWILFYTVYLKEEAAGMLKGMLLSQITLLPVYLWFQFHIFKSNFCWKYIKPTLKYCLPMLPALLSAWVINMSSQIFIERSFTINDVAIYSLAQKLVSVVSIVFSAFITAYSPTFYRVANDKGFSNPMGYLFNVQNTIVVISIICTSSIAILGKDILTLLFPSDYLAGVDIIAILIFGTIVSQLTGFLNLSCYQNKKTNIVMWITLTSAGITIGLNSILVPIYSLYGAAITYTASAIVIFIFTSYYARKYFYVPFKWNVITPLAFILIGLYALNRYILPVSWLYSTIKVVSVLPIGVAIYFWYKKKTTNQS